VKGEKGREEEKADSQSEGHRQQEGGEAGALQGRPPACGERA